MIDVHKIMYCLMIMTLLVVSQVCIGIALPAQLYHELDQIAHMVPRPDEFGIEPMPGPPGEPPMRPFFSGHGFALMGNESHDIMLTVAALMPPDPMQVQRLLASGKSIEELSDEINEMQRKAFYRGGIRLDGMIYPLDDIKLSLPGEKPILLYANVIEPPFGLTISNETAIAGNIKVVMAHSEKGIAGDGELIMNTGSHAGSYHVMLDMQPNDHDMI